jgi:hypothetical protein
MRERDVAGKVIGRVRELFIEFKKKCFAVFFIFSILNLPSVFLCRVSTFRPRGVPGPTSKLSPRAPTQMGRRETEHEGGK